MTLKRLMIFLGILVFLAGVGIAWLWQYAYSPEGRARMIIAQIKDDPRVIPGARKLLNDPDSVVRDIAAGVLEDLGEKPSPASQPGKP